MDFKPPSQNKPRQENQGQKAAETPQKKVPQKVQQPRAKQAKGKIKVSTVIGTMLLNVLKAVFVVGCMALIVGSFVGVQMVRYVVDATQNDETLMDLDTYALAQTSYFMVYNPDNPNAREDNDYIPYQELIDEENRIWKPLAEMPDDLINAVVSTEDREFWDHHGVNFRRTIAALINEVIPVEGMRGGASTITQQLVKNIMNDADVITEEEGALAGYKRKMREIFRAWGLENRYSKEMILESYLNTIGLSERIAGVEAGAQKYFGKTVSELTLAESAVIAGITQAPTKYSPFQNPENSLNRRNTVIEFMRQAGYITQEEAEEVWAMPLGLALNAGRDDDDINISGTFSYISDKVYYDVIDDLMKEYDMTKQAAFKLLYNGGLRVYLTADLNVQHVLDEIVGEGYREDEENPGFFFNQSMFPGYKNKLEVDHDVKNSTGQVIKTVKVRPEVAAVVLNYDGELIATIGGIGEKTDSLGLNRSMGTVKYNAKGEPYMDGTVRQVGSTMKPIATYALGLDYGIIHYSQMIKDDFVMAKDPLKSTTPDWPKNFGTIRKTNIPIVSAVAESTNTVAVQVAMYIGLDEMYSYLTETVGITSLVEADHYSPSSLALGGNEYGISLYELAGAYTVFGGNDTYGVFTPLHSYSRVEDSRGNVILEPDTAQQQAIDPQTGYIMNRLLYNVVHTGSYPGGASPTAGGMAIPGDMESVGKTGTTSDDRDRLFVGLTPYYVMAVWWGYDYPDDHDFRKHYWSPAARTNIPVNVWKAVMTEVQEEYPYKEFPEMPDGIRTERFCTNSGDLAVAGCPSMVGYYASFNVPEHCRGHRAEEPPPEEAPPE